MNRIIFLFILLMMIAVPCMAQTIAMEDAHLAFEYPQSWLVLSPQLAMVYEPLLTERGMDAGQLSLDMEKQGVLSRAYSPDFAQRMSVLVRSDDLSEDIFEISMATDEQRKTLRSRVEKNNLWETTGYRAQDVEWQREGGVYWLYVHYTRTNADQIIGRGLRYITVHNGQYAMIDWQIDSGRFGNRELNQFRAMTHDLTVTETIEQPVRSVRLAAHIPQETNVGDLIIEGSASPDATLLAEAPDKNGDVQMLSVGVAGSSGKFSLLVPLEEEGVYDITLTASKEGMIDASVEGTVSYSAKKLPVSVEGVEDAGVHTVTQDKTVLTGKTLAGVQIQLVTPFGLSKKRAGNDGTFSFELSTKDAGEYRYTLILDKKGFDQRRMPFSLVRVMTDDQERANIRKTAEKISYKNLQKDLDENRGKVMNLYGPVTQVSSSGSAHYVRMQFNKAADGTWYNPVVIVAQEDMGAKEGDMISAVVKVDGVFEEQDAEGNTVMVPRFELMFVDRVE